MPRVDRVSPSYWCHICQEIRDWDSKLKKKTRALLYSSRATRKINCEEHFRGRPNGECSTHPYTAKIPLENNEKTALRG